MPIFIASTEIRSQHEDSEMLSVNICLKVCAYLFLPYLSDWNFSFFSILVFISLYCFSELNLYVYYQC